MNTDAMIFVGRFSEADLKDRKDKNAIEMRKKICPAFKYVYAQDVKKGRKTVALDIYLSSRYV